MGAGERRVIGYARVSTEEQGVSGLGIAAQREAITAECKRQGWILMEIVEDVASGKDLDRHGMTRVLAMLDAGEVDGLVASKTDRVSRSTRDFFTLLDRAQRRGWTVTLAEMPIDTTIPMGEAMVGSAAVYAQLERRLIAQRTRDALAVKKAQGVVLGRPQSLPDDLVRRIVREYDAGDGLSLIARRLQSENIPTARGGTTWRASTIKAVLASAAADRLRAESSVSA